jgi:hypothetical protein
VFLGRAVKAPQIRRVDRASKTKIVHMLRITHRDEVETPITDWLREAYELSDVLAVRKPPPGRASPKRTARKRKTVAARKAPSRKPAAAKRNRRG